MRRPADGNLRHSFPGVIFPQRQQIPRFGAVAVLPFLQSHRQGLSERDCHSILLQQRQQIPRFGAVAVPHPCTYPCRGLTHLPKVRRFPAFSAHLPKVCRCITASRTPCGRISPSAVPVPPSEGETISRVFRPPSEGGHYLDCLGRLTPLEGVDERRDILTPSEGVSGGKKL